MSRKIKFLPDSGSILSVSADNNLTVGQFITLLTQAGGQFSLEKNLLTEKRSKATFLTADSLLPDGDISLFSTIKDPKGNLSRNEIYAAIKEHIERDGEAAKEHFNYYGNYTRTSSEVLEELLEEYAPVPVKRATTPAPKKTASAPTKTKAVQSSTDADDAELIAAQRAFAPRLTRNK